MLGTEAALGENSLQGSGTHVQRNRCTLPAPTVLLRRLPPAYPTGMGRLCLAPDPATTESQARSCHCVFLPALVPPILASSSRCRASSRLSCKPLFN